MRPLAWVLDLGFLGHKTTTGVLTHFSGFSPIMILTNRPVSPPFPCPMLNSRIPSGPLSQKWSDFKDHCRLVSPKNKQRHTILIVGTGLAGASAAAS